MDKEIPIVEYGKFDSIIACEVIYWEQSINPLITIVDELFTKQDNDLVFYLIFLERNVMLHTMLKEELEKFGFAYEYLKEELLKEFTVHASFLFKITRKSEV